MLRQWSPTFASWWPDWGRRGELGHVSSGLAHAHTQPHSCKSGCHFILLQASLRQKLLQRDGRPEAVWDRSAEAFRPFAKAKAEKRNFGGVVSSSFRLPEAARPAKSRLGVLYRQLQWISEAEHSASALNAPLLVHWEKAAWRPGWWGGRGEWGYVSGGLACKKEEKSLGRCLCKWRCTHAPARFSRGLIVDCSPRVRDSYVKKQDHTSFLK